jgi:hypothetical protein
MWENRSSGCRPSTTSHKLRVEDAVSVEVRLVSLIVVVTDLVILLILTVAEKEVLRVIRRDFDGVRCDELRLPDVDCEAVGCSVNDMVAGDCDVPVVALDTVSDNVCKRDNSG